MAQYWVLIAANQPPDYKCITKSKLFEIDSANQFDAKVLEKPPLVDDDGNTFTPDNSHIPVEFTQCVPLKKRFKY
jgi:hypothetical protein